MRKRLGIGDKYGRLEQVITDILKTKHWKIRIDSPSLENICRLKIRDGCWKYLTTAFNHFKKVFILQSTHIPHVTLQQRIRIKNKKPVALFILMIMWPLSTADWLVGNDVVWPVLCACANPRKNRKSCNLIAWISSDYFESLFSLSNVVVERRWQFGADSSIILEFMALRVKARGDGPFVL